MNCTEQNQRTSSIIVFPAIFGYMLFVSIVQNTPILGPFRLVDLWIWCVIFFLIIRYRHFNPAYLLWCLAIFAFAIASSLQGAATRQIVSLDEYIFYYKYATLFATLFIAYLVASGQTVFKCKYWNVLLIFISAYLSIYVVLFTFNNPLAAVTNSTRVSVPFSNVGPSASNSPMFSVVLAMLILASMSLMRASILLRVSIVTLLVIALLLAGSRSGFFVLVLFGSVYFIRAPASIKLLVAVVVIALFAFMTSFSDDTLAAGLYERTTNFELSSDQSAGDRLSKQWSAIFDVLENDLWLGLGHEYTRILWYDGMVGNSLIMFGFWGVVLFFWGVVLYLYKLNRCMSFAATVAKPSFFVASLLVPSLITEFALISYPLGIVLFITIVAVTRHKNHQDYNNLLASQSVAIALRKHKRNMLTGQNKVRI